MKTDDKVVIVTGGSSGIGRASALAFAQEGVRVVVADINIQGGKQTVQMVKKFGGKATYFRVDVSNSVEVKDMVAYAVKTYGRLDYAFNNAGITLPFTYTTDLNEEDWDRIISINLKGVWLCMKYEIPEILKTGGVIVNTSSICGVVGSPRAVAYTASKHGIIGLTKTAALEYAAQGIRINALAPGPIDTPMMNSMYAERNNLNERINTAYPLKRLGTTEEVAKAVVWLCSDAASLINGHTLALDGGFTIQ